MSRFCGVVGFATTVEDPIDSGNWIEKLQERRYYGDVKRDTRRLQTVENVNQDVVSSNTIEIVMDVFAMNNFHAIRYVVWRGSKWQVPTVEVREHRLVLYLSGLYNAAAQ